MSKAIREAGTGCLGLLMRVREALRDTCQFSGTSYRADELVCQVFDYDAEELFEVRIRSLGKPAKEQTEGESDETN